ncbi:MAG: hypothetical protein RLW61_11625 [Gammaproteobacteria bacterium]
MMSGPVRFVSFGPARRLALASLLSAVSFLAAATETTVSIGAGDTFTADDFLAGEFLGQPFVLGPQTTFVVDDGGLMLPWWATDFLDFEDSAVTVNTGGTAGRLLASRVHVSLEGGSLEALYNGWRSSLEMRGGTFLLSGRIIEGRGLFEGGTIDASQFEFMQSDVTVTDIQANGQFMVNSLSTASISGGSFAHLRVSTSQLAASGGYFAMAEINNSTADISGGTFGTLATRDSTLHMSSGVFDVLSANDSTIEFSAGLLRQAATLRDSEAYISAGLANPTLSVTGGELTLAGDDFMLDGVPITADAISGGLPPGSFLSGTMADGTVFVFRTRSAVPGEFAHQFSRTSDITPDILRFERGHLGAVDSTPRILDAGTGPQGLRPGEVLTLAGSARMDNAVVNAATLNVNGATVNGLRAAYATIAIAAGTVQGTAELAASTLGVSGGTLDQLELYGSQATIGGAEVAVLYANASEATVDASVVGSVNVDNGGTVTISGSTIGSMNLVQAAATTVTGSAVDKLTVGQTLSGAAQIGTDPVSVTDTDIRELQTIGTAFTMEGGSVSGRLFDWGGSVLSFRDVVLGDPQAEFGTSILLGNATTLEVTGGVLDFGILAARENTVTIRGGQIGNTARDPSMSGPLSFLAGTTLNVHGGDFAPGFLIIGSGAAVNLFVTAASLDGTPLDLARGDMMSFGGMGGALLSAVLADGAELDFFLGGLGDGSYTPLLLDGATLNLHAVAPVPLPAGGPLLVSALAGLLSATGRRRERVRETHTLGRAARPRQVGNTGRRTCGLG